jgi:uncharacterized RDD family membrane protein YckC
METDSLRYAGFWPRLGSMLLDFLILAPYVALSYWGRAEFRLFNLYFFIPGILFSLFFSVYLVARFGGTPGKLIVGIRIRKLNGEPVDYREAFLRTCVDLFFGVVLSVALIPPLFHMTDAEYFSLSSAARVRHLIELAPWWYRQMQWAGQIWVWGELIVLLTNRKRRAIHDFIAGTVVVYAKPRIPAEITPAPVSA